MHLEHGDIVGGFIDDTLDAHPSRRTAVKAVRTVFPSEDFFELVHIEQATRAFDHALVDFIECRASLEEQIAAVLKLVARILVAKPRAALFFDIEAKAQTARINPTLAPGTFQTPRRTPGRT